MPPSSPADRVDDRPAPPPAPDLAEKLRHDHGIEVDELDQADADALAGALPSTGELLEKHRLLSVPEVGQFLGLGRDAVYELIRSGELGSITVAGRSRRVPTWALARYVADRVKAESAA